jgi:putative ABC transport system ATP-binding protein
MIDPSANTSLLRTEHLTRIYPDGAVNALVDVNLSIERGEYVCIMGPSGCGKSTLLNLLGGLDRPTSGEVFFENKPLSAMGDLARFRANNIGFVFQSFLLIPTLTAVENVQVPMFETTHSAAERARKARDLLATVGMSHRVRHLPRSLSVGERQRVAIARALANTPAIVLADEPTGNLDSQRAAEVLDLFDQLHRGHGITFVVVTHSDALAQRAKRVVRLSDGRIVDDTAGGAR